MELSPRFPMLAKRLITASGRMKYRATSSRGVSSSSRGWRNSTKTKPANSRPSHAPRDRVSSIHTHMTPQQQK